LLFYQAPLGNIPKVYNLTKPRLLGRHFEVTSNASKAGAPTTRAAVEFALIARA
jgi:hypothetical protein